MTTPTPFGIDSAEVFFLCAEHSNDVIMITDHRGVIRYVNQAFEKIYQYSRDEVVGQTPGLLRSGVHDREFYGSMWDDILDPAKEMWRGEVVNRAKDGSDVPVLLSISPFRKDDATLGYMSIALDIREQKRMEAQILHQDRLASIGLLASGLAHEIGTPMGVIRGRAEYLLMQAHNSSERSGLETIVTQIDRISKLIYSLLNVARVGKLGAVAAVEVRSVLNDVAVLIEPMIQGSGIELRLRVGDGVRVLADSGRLEQLLLNLLVNAIHAVGTAQTSGATRDWFIAVDAKRTGNQWEFVVSDAGCGISEENLKKIFTPFFTTKEVGTGTGLGLMMCQNIVGSFGGKLWVESPKGQGASFYFTIPAANETSR